jgi:protein-tyrosine phosphatase
VSLAMARMAADDGVQTIICTPHQAGNFSANRGDVIRAAVRRTQQMLAQRGVPLTLLPGGDVRIESDMISGLRRGDLLTLGDHGRHVLLELPHELYFPLEPVLRQLDRHQMVGILSHPERNQGILRQPEVLLPLVEAGCLMQVTAGSILRQFWRRNCRFLRLDVGRRHGALRGDRCARRRFAPPDHVRSI